MPLRSALRDQIRENFEKFLAGRAKGIRSLRITDLHINPFLVRVLAKQMGFENSRLIVKWLVAQRLERGMVTAFGKTLQDVAKLFSEGTGVEGADILKTRRGRHYHIQVKSGPNSIPKELGTQISKLLRSAQRRNQGSVAMFAMCYGTEEQVSGIVRKYVEQEGGVTSISGRRFWQFISGDRRCMDEIYEIAGEVCESFRDAEGRTLAGLIDSKTTELEVEFMQLYGDSEAQVWKRMLDRNT